MTKKDQEQDLLVSSYDHGGYVAWGWWRSWDGLGGLKYCIRRSIKRLDRFPKLKWGFHIEGATWDWALANDPAFVAEFKALVEKEYAGRISLSSGGYGQPLSCAIGEEANVRQLVYDREAYDALGCRVNVYMQNEHGFFPQMPQLLKGVGIDKAVVRTVWGMYGICPEIDGSKVRWRSPDGSWVEAIPTYLNENRGIGKNTWDTRIMLGMEGVIDLEPFRRYYLDRGIRYPFAIRIDDYHLPVDVNNKIKTGGFERLCDSSNLPGIRWVTAEEAFAEIPLEEIDFDTAIDDYVLQMPWGYHGNIYWNLNRQAECRLLTAERLAAVNVIHGGATWEETLKRAWRQLLIAQHHDVVICGASGGGEYGRTMQDVAKQLYGEAINAAEAVIKANLRSTLFGLAKGSAARLVLAYNPLNWSRRMVVTFEVRSQRDHLPLGFKLFQDGRPMEYQVLKTEILAGGTLSYTTLAVPLELGPQSFALLNLDFVYEAAELTEPRLLPVNEDERAIRITTGWGEVRIDRSTGEYLAYDAQGRPLLVPGARNGLLKATIDDEPHVSMPKAITVESRGPLMALVRTTGKIGPLSYITEAVIYRDQPRLDFRTTVEVHGQTIGSTNVPAEWNGKQESVTQTGKLMVAFTPALTGPAKVIQDFPFMAAETHNQVINAGCWVDIADEERGLTLTNRGTMGYVWDGASLSNILLYSGRYSHGEHQAYLEGEYPLEYGVSFHQGDYRTGHAHRLGLEYNYPAVAIADLQRNDMTLTGETFQVADGNLSLVEAQTGETCPNLIVSAMYTHKGLPYLRVYDYLGVASTAIRATMGNRPVKFIPVNLLHEEQGEPTEIAKITAYQIATFRLVIG
ncbi:MAG: hypothetical protein ACM3ZC_14630 [Bacteroidota bacterium]